MTFRLKKKKAKVAQPALILQVSTQTVYNWEAGSSWPSQEQLTKLAILKKMGKRKVQATLKQLADH
ncbi:helix-turn-helix domain-containing protein [Denitratisoma oestradiolicum]|uniref:helix-turn-helix domain-containing protein n=1 Tax=Denitratisoma oestradiolicum TaxID=311182 RepID=UPI00147779BB|nr:helix-turn-helix domain-containing protein [Denitratisoma oestradiolicum]